MSKSRIKITRPAIRTRSEMESLVGDIAALKIRERKLTAQMDARIKAARDEYEGALGEIKKSIDEKMAVAQDWAEANPSEFGTLKSIDLVHAVVGWRIGNPTLKTIAGWTWDRVLESIRDGLDRFIRIKEEVNKAQILAEREQLGPDTLRLYGMRVVQDESFYVDPKQTEVENREVAA